MYFEAVAVSPTTILPSAATSEAPLPGKGTAPLSVSVNPRAVLVTNETPSGGDCGGRARPTIVWPSGVIPVAKTALLEISRGCIPVLCCQINAAGCTFAAYDWPTTV